MPLVDTMENTILILSKSIYLKRIAGYRAQNLAYPGLVAGSAGSLIHSLRRFNPLHHQIPDSAKITLSLTINAAFYNCSKVEQRVLKIAAEQENGVVLYKVFESPCTVSIAFITVAEWNIER